MQHLRPSSYDQWLADVPSYLCKDPLWGFIAYPKALFLYDLVWFDCEHLMKDMRGRAIVHQIISSAGSIGANIEEGYGKGFGPDYARFLEIALGSARETRGWYWRAKHLLSSEVLEHRYGLLSEIIALLTTVIPQQRKIKRKRPSS